MDLFNIVSFIVTRDLLSIFVRNFKQYCKSSAVIRRTYDVLVDRLTHSIADSSLRNDS
jgi:hypothetical protein